MSRYLVSEIRCLGCDALVSEQAGPVHACGRCIMACSGTGWRR